MVCSLRYDDACPTVREEYRRGPNRDKCTGPRTALRGDGRHRNSTFLAIRDSHIWIPTANTVPIVVALETTPQVGYSEYKNTRIHAITCKTTCPVYRASSRCRTWASHPIQAKTADQSLLMPSEPASRPVASLILPLLHWGTTVFRHLCAAPTTSKPGLPSSPRSRDTWPHC